VHNKECVEQRAHTLPCGIGQVGHWSDSDGACGGSGQGRNRPILRPACIHMLHHSPSPDLSMAVVLYQQSEMQNIELKVMEKEAEGQTPSPNSPQLGVLPGPG